MIYILLALQLLAHVLSDFYFQPNSFCDAKREKGACCWQIYVHALIVFVMSWLMSMSLSFWWVALVIAVSHWVLDVLKSKYLAFSWSFFIDQIMHIVILSVMVIVYYRVNAIVLPSWLNVRYLVGILGIVIILKPMNIVMREFISSAEIKLPASLKSTDGELPNAGKWIGIIERLLVYVFVLGGQFEAIGFLIAAKSLLRFNDKDMAKSEYLLVGTLISFASAIIIGMLVAKIVKNL